MHTYTQILYQIVFHTKYNQKTLTGRNRKYLFRYIAKIINANRSFVYQIGGVSNHIHIIVRLHPATPLSELVKMIKLSTSKLIKEEELFPDFIGWQTGYSAFTYSKGALNNLVRYVQNQEIHHKEETSQQEHLRLLKEHHISPLPRVAPGDTRGYPGIPGATKSSTYPQCPRV